MKNDTRLRRKVAPDLVQRKRRFTAALSLAGLDQQGFALRYDLAPSHLSRALNGRVPLTGRTRETVDRFIAKYLPDLAA